ncbi:MAG: hypothetical protein F9K18_07145 [Thermoanaerobaculia bacterium]|nr:MAG: hypothetical protein F9K18_07145 [Thermoanaerobaculia bacterium]
MRVLRLFVSVFLVVLAAAAARADWLVWVGGGIRETRGALEVRGRQVRFHDVSGTLMSVPLEDVDVAASEFVSWQVSATRASKMPGVVPWERKAPPPVAATKATAPLADGRPCAAGSVVRVVDSETVEVAVAGARRIVHLACVDGPEERNRFPELAYFGRETEGVLAALLLPGARVCVAEEGERPLTDRAGHGIAYLRFPDGRDAGAELVRRGYGVSRGGACGLRSRYLELERQAVAEEVGHWGPTANQVAVAVVANALAFHAVGPPMRAGGGG